MILGMPFLKNERISIDMHRRKLSKGHADGSRVDFYFDDRNNVVNVVFEDVPIYSQYDVKLSKNNDLRVAVESIPINFQQNVNFLFEPASKKGLSGIDGVLSVENGRPNAIVMQCTDNKEHVIRKGERLGRISSIVECDSDDNTESTWSMDELINRVELGDHLSEDDRRSVLALLLKTQNALSRNENDIGQAKVVPHVIELTNKTPIWQRPRQFPTPVNREIDKQCSELISNDIIELSDSRWSSPIVPVRKKDGQLRLCVDYRKLNAVTRTDNFPMPNLSEAIYGAQGVRFFTKLDLIRGYYQIPLEKESRKYTAFSTAHSHFQFKRLSFGLKNSGIAFQKCMQQILAEFCYSNVIIYIDDILLMTRTFEEHLILVEKVLSTLMYNGIKIKLDKCEFFQREVQFLGHVIGEHGIRKSREFIDKVLEYPKPKTVTELRQFLGLVNFQRKFVNQCSSIAKPLTSVTNGPKRKAIVWNKEMDEAFDNLKIALSEEVALSFPDYSEGAEKLELFVDASGIGAGACLLQWQGESYKTIGYTSMTFNDAQRRYSTIERELTALRWGIKSFRPFVFGVPFVLFTDHKPLLYLYNMARDNSRMMRTLNELSDYEFTIKYRPGKENNAADAMSRIVSVPERDGNEMTCEPNLPPGMHMLKLVEGGGNSLFVSLLECMKDQRNSMSSVVPSDHMELRRVLTSALLQNPAKYGVRPDKEWVKRIKNMSQEGQLPCEEVLSVVSNTYNVQVWVHHGTRWPVIYKCDDISDAPKLHVQCVSGIHFNALFERNPDSFNSIQEKCINHSNLLACPQTNVARDEVGVAQTELPCEHSRLPASSCVLEMCNVKMCALIDTGSQICLITDKVYRLLNDNDSTLTLRSAYHETVAGINNTETRILGVVDLKPSLFDIPVQHSIPFAVVRHADMPCCCILGANFLSVSQITVDFHKSILRFGDHEAKQFLFSVKVEPLNHGRRCHDYNVARFIGEITVSESAGESNNNTDEVQEDDICQAKIRFVLSEADIIGYQDSDPVVSLLKSKIVNRIHPRNWNDDVLSCFKRLKNLNVSGKLLTCDQQGQAVPVIPFSLLVELAHKVHVQLAHIGKNKLINTLKTRFYHPSMTKVVSDICFTCPHCQLYKVSSQPISPPTIKINSRFPFDLFAMDLLQFPRSSNGNIAAFVAIDHFSKFLFAVPIKDKKSSTICKVLSTRIFPSMLRLPVRILSDNGPEFRSAEFDSLLQRYNITHIFSTRYRAAGNGAVERVNRTIIELLRALVSENERSWDTEINQAVIVYNNTWHVQLNDSPSSFVLKNAHAIDNVLPVPSDSLQNWKDSHPNFESFVVDQKVAMKINRIGNKLEYKLARKFSGPYTVSKVQSNGVTYEIRDSHGNVFKAHHKQLKPWREIPSYLTDILPRYDGSLPHDDSDSSTTSDSDVMFLPCIFTTDDENDNLACNVDNDVTEKVHKTKVRRKSTRIASKPQPIAELSLDSFRCTEVIKDVPTDIVDLPVGSNDTFTIDKSLMEWSFDSDIVNLMSDEEQVRVSSPIFQDDNVCNVDMTCRVSSIGVNTTTQEISPESVDSFAAWLEQSLLAQESMVSHIEYLNDARLESIASNPDHDETMDNRDITHTIRSANHHLQYVRKCSKSFKECASEKKNTWQTRYVPVTDDDVSAELSDIILNLSSDILDRWTRSKGPVAEYPNVQKNILEYKSKQK